MAAEKLTKARLIQIIFLMAVLITAFVWRTVTYEETATAEDSAVVCHLSAKSCKQEGQEKVLALSLTPFPAKADTELVLHIDNTNVKPVCGSRDVFGGAPQWRWRGHRQGH